MTRVFQELERVEGRVLGALRCFDSATGADIVTPLALDARNGRARFVRNRSGVCVVSFWSELAAHEEAFLNPPAAPPVGSLELEIAIADPTGRYLPRLVRPHLVILPAKPVKPCLLLPLIRSRWPGRLRFQSPVQAFMPSVLLRTPGPYPFQADP